MESTINQIVNTSCCNGKSSVHGGNFRQWFWVGSMLLSAGKLGDLCVWLLIILLYCILSLSHAPSCAVFSRARGAAAHQGEGGRRGGEYELCQQWDACREGTGSRACRWTKNGLICWHSGWCRILPHRERKFGQKFWVIWFCATVCAATCRASWGLDHYQIYFFRSWEATSSMKFLLFFGRDTACNFMYWQSKNLAARFLISFIF